MDIADRTGTVFCQMPHQPLHSIFWLLPRFRILPESLCCKSRVSLLKRSLAALRLAVSMIMYSTVIKRCEHFAGSAAPAMTHGIVSFCFLCFWMQDSQPVAGQSTPVISTSSLTESSIEDRAEAANAMLYRYFAQETDKITQNCFGDVQTLQDWENQKDQRRNELLEMLGLYPLPEKTNLQPVVTGSAEAEGVVVENLYFESSPGLFVTGNLYRPKKQTGPLPAVLYVCGHGRVKKDGVSYGNKTHYQHHGAWFARNGYVCLTIDTIQLGELEGIHHGTYREKMWWWNNRGYTPAGVEAWNCMRSIDYLQSRSEVDPNRIGVTGRSGGGAYSWWIAAIDERIKVAVPVAGITSMQNHVVDGCIEGHCDCMFMVNTYRWDYPMVAALVAPRALLISNTDKDRIFPLDGVVDVHRKVARIYDLHNATDKLGLHITEGPHQDTQELRIHAFRWFNRFLRGTEELIDLPATKLFTPEQLKVFKTLPENERVTLIHESFVPIASNQSVPNSSDELDSFAKSCKEELVDKTFAGWNGFPNAIEPRSLKSIKRDEIIIQEIEYSSDELFELTMFRLSLSNSKTDQTVVTVLDNQSWDRFSSTLNRLLQTRPDKKSDAPQEIAELKRELQDHHLIVLSPRGVGQCNWQADERTQTQIRRRFMQIGQTLTGMQIYDVITAFRVIRSLPDFHTDQFHLQATGEAASWTLFASLFEGGFDSLQLAELPTSHRFAPDLLNVSRVATLPQIAMIAAASNQHLTVTQSDSERAAKWKASLRQSELADRLITIQESQ